MNRYPFADLAAAMRLSLHAAAVQLGLSGSTELRYRRDGIPANAADRFAVRAGLHPMSVWPSWLDDELERYGRPCTDCGQPFLPWRSDQRFCSRSCSRRLHARLTARRRRSRPDVAAANRAARRAYYEAHGEYERARERRRYAERRARQSTA